MLKLSTESLDWALQHALTKGDTDIFPTAFEFLAIRHDWQRLQRCLANHDVLSWISRPLRRCLSPKRRYGFRVATQLDPLDFLLFSALLYEVGSDIEAHRLDTQTVFSYRFAPQEDGTLFDGEVGYSAFQARSRELASQVSDVVVTDIADFFPRLYSHRVEGALTNATKKNNHVRSITQLLSQWNQTQSYGIPIGPAPSRLIAEISLDDVDKLLISESIRFVRYMDDYRLFADSPIQGYQQLTILANALFKNHGLTLQQEKTTILPANEFVENYCSTSQSEEFQQLSSKFDNFLEHMGMDDPYGDIDYDDLDVDDKALIDSWNLSGMLANELEKDEIDQHLVRFLLRRLGQLDDKSVVELILSRLNRTFTVFPQVIQYFARLRTLSDQDRNYVTAQLLNLMSDSYVSQLEYHRCWLLSLFSEGPMWGNSEKMASLYSDSQDNFSRRKLTLALGRSGQDYWFRTRKEDVFEFGGWLRRAFLAGAKCLPMSERKHWYSFLNPRLDIVERSIVSWVQVGSP